MHGKVVILAGAYLWGLVLLLWLIVGAYHFAGPGMAEAGRLRFRAGGRIELPIASGFVYSRTQRVIVSPDQIPAALIRAILYQEDRAFYDHPGYSLRENFIVLRDAVLSGDRLRGASTLTQQLARILFLEQNPTLRRKLIELRIAQILEARLSKTAILQLYINYVYWGGACYGIDCAARRIFGVSPENLNRSQIAYLVAMLPAPNVCVRPEECSDERLLFRRERLLRHLE